MIRILLVLALLAQGALAQDLGLPALPSAGRSGVSTSLPVVDRARLESMQATRRTTENSLHQVGLVVEKYRAALEELATQGDDQSVREKQADLTRKLDVAREAEHQYRDAIRLTEERLALEDEKRQANAERARQLDVEAAAEKTLANDQSKSFTLEQADQAKAALAGALERQRLMQARVDRLKAEEEALERAATEAATVLSRRESELSEVREKLASEGRRGDEVSHLANFARVSELQRGQAKTRVQHLEERRGFLVEKRQAIEFALETASLAVGVQRRLSEFIADRASVSQGDVNSSGEKLIEKEQEREKRAAAGEIEARKADAERAAAVERRNAAEDEMARAKRPAEKELARAKVELATLAIDEAEARKRVAETQVALAQADFERERERVGYYALMRDIRANTVSNTELQERRREVRASLNALALRLDAAERQVEEGRLGRRAADAQIAQLTARLQALESTGDRALAPRVREQQRALTRVSEQRDEAVALQVSLIAALSDTKRLLSDLERRLDRELGISRIWERKASALSTESMRNATKDLGEIQAGVSIALTRLSTQGSDLAREAFSLKSLTLALLTLLLAYLDLAFVLWARRRLGAAGTVDPTEPRDVGRALSRIAHRTCPFAGLLLLSLVIAGWVPPALTGVLITMSGWATVAAGTLGILNELLAPWTEEGRLIRCSTPVARHVHGHLRRILFLSAMFVPVIQSLPYVFAGLSRGPHTALADMLWAIYKLGMVVEISLLAYPRELVLSLLPEGGGRLAAMATGTLRVLYPAITLFILSLFALGAVGYVDLARFLWVATLQTVLAVAFAWGAQKLLHSTLTAVLVGHRELPPDGEPDDRHLAALTLVSGTTRLVRYALTVAVLIGFYFIWGGDPEGMQTMHRYGRMQMNLGPFVLSPYALLQAGLTLYMALLASRYLQRFLESAVYPTTDFDTGIQYAVSTAVHYFVMAIGLSYSMERVGLGMEYVKWFVGAIGVGAGFGLQNIVYNIISGLVVLVERPVKLGDWIEVGGVTGRVEKISIRSTTVCNSDDIEVIIPNAELVSQKVSNWTHTNTVTRIRCPVRVAYGTDTEVMRRLLLDVAKTNSNVLAHPAPQALLRQLGEHSLDFELAVAVRDPAQRTITSSELNMAIEKALRKARIAIPHNVAHVWEPGLNRDSFEVRTKSEA